MRIDSNNGNVGSMTDVVQGTTPFKFTGQERDPETGLDYFIARHYASNLGRFLQPDEFTGGPVDAFSSNDPLQPGPLPYANITNPLSLNKYTYTFNNPLRYTDPNGHSGVGVVVRALLPAVIAGVTGFTIGVGLEVKRQIQAGEDLDIGAAAREGIKPGLVSASATAAATFNSPGLTVGAVTAANTVGGIIKNSIDGDPNTNPTQDVQKDALVGLAAGTAGAVTDMVAGDIPAGIVAGTGVTSTVTNFIIKKAGAIGRGLGKSAAESEGEDENQDEEDKDED